VHKRAPNPYSMNVEPDPSPTYDPLAMPATRGLVLRLAAEGHLDPAARDAALRILRPADSGRRWWLWIGRLLVAVGSSLVLAGVIFFFAYNWSAIPPLAKLGLVQGIVVLFAVAAWRFGFDSVVGQALLVGASVAVGALLAVFGQVYQTGADSYELFVGWAALVAGWAIVSRSTAHWILWVAIVDFAIGLYWAQVLEPTTRPRAASWELCMLAIAVVNGAALAVVERAAAARWARWVLWASVLVLLSVPSCALIADLSESDRFEPLVALAAALATGFWYFRYRARDLLSLTLGTLSACALVLTAVARLFQDGKELALLSFGLVVLAVFSGATLWLRATGAAMVRERRDG
jgi:uncharacterized membrane protein